MMKIARHQTTDQNAAVIDQIRTVLVQLRAVHPGVRAAQKCQIGSFQPPGCLNIAGAQNFQNLPGIGFFFCRSRLRGLFTPVPRKKYDRYAQKKKQPESSLPAAECGQRNILSHHVQIPNPQLFTMALRYHCLLFFQVGNGIFPEEKNRIFLIFFAIPCKKMLF